MARLARTIATFVAASVPLVAGAQEQGADTWQWSGEVYFWGPSLSGETTSGDDLSLGIDKILENLNFGLMGAVAAQRGPWTIFGDYIYLNLEDDIHTSANVVGLDVKARADIKLQGWISTAGAAYRVIEKPGYSLDVLGGGRILWLDTELDYDVSSAVGSIDGSVSEKDTALDAIVGIRGEADLSDKWYLTYYGDIGAGQSDLTGQALASVNYRLGRADLSVGYRYLHWDLRDFGPIDTLDLHGPFVGVRFDF